MEYKVPLVDHRQLARELYRMYRQGNCTISCSQEARAIAALFVSAASTINLEFSEMPEYNEDQ
jgi:hypothetical protein